MSHFPRSAGTTRNDHCFRTVTTTRGDTHSLLLTTSVVAGSECAVRAGEGAPEIGHRH
ncbi:hypothetical protein FRAAL5422 [Frankia alni ACN14a]|uniref:Uncharacterized protein n=1 Tax=Frankia alni (strain DSM 45986 / CECT 9034 / ACN14a) TaxID=326424 RepID=Q0REQ2_FRAAA|nr:hypothetical protein FRAAL5422 [Frankia alni ACN14a]